MSFPFFKQPDSMDCGPTCLRMIAKHYKRSISLQYLREKTQIGKEGVNLLGISEAAESIGFRTKSVKLTYNLLVKESKLPAILHWNQKHFVVLYKAKNNKLFIADPARGLINYSPAEFKHNWISDKSAGQEEGIALLLEPAPAFYNELNEGAEGQELNFRNIFNYVLPYKKLVFQLLLGLGIATLLQLFIPFLTQSVVDVGVNTGNIHFVYIVLFAQLALFIGRLVVEFLRGWILLHISTRINVSILTDFLVKLMRLPLSFFDSKRTGDILQRMNDHSRIESFLTGSSLSTLFSFLNLIVFSILLVVFNAYIFAVFAIASLLYSGWVFLFLKKRKKLDHRRFDVSSKKQSITIQLVQGMQEIKLHGTEKQMRWGWESLQARLVKLSMKGLALDQWQQSGATLINETKNIFIIFLSAKAVIDGQMTLGSMLAVQYMVGQLNSPISQLIGFMQSWQNAKISMDRLNEIHKIEDEEPTDKQFQYQLPPSYAKLLVGGTGPSTVEEYELHYPSHNVVVESDKQRIFTQSTNLDSSHKHAIHFNNLSFTYAGAGNEPVLKNINLQIPIGKTTAIVGTSGSGKTTLLKLLLKFYDPQKGEIRFDNVALSNISHRTWRSHCGVVMQESFIFSDTIAKNIAIGIDKIDMERLYNAARTANILEFVETLPLGFNSKIGAEGIGISTGQKQRILIARAVYRNPEFIFFDEATNSLDANNESMILNNLKAFLKGKTVIVVAHRLSTVKNADQIILLNKGEVEEKGTHQELINLKGAYYTLIKNQLELGN
jgi:ATP-binding cassette, subfamily B, bacterial